MTGNTRVRLATVACLCVTMLISLVLSASPALADTLENAQAAAKKRDWKTAAEEYAKILKKNPQHRAAAIGLTTAAVKAGRTDLFTMVEDALLVLRAQGGGDWEVQIALGQISMAQGAAKNDTLAKKSYDAQAVECFTAALKARPTSDAAAAGLARVYFESANFQAAVDVVDNFLRARPVTSSAALYWKGQALYFQAQDAFQASGGRYPLPEKVKTLFRRAHGSYRASTAQDPKSYEAWLQLGYTSAYLGDRSTAMEGYQKALALDQESTFPFKGLQSILSHDKAALTDVLRHIVANHPKHPQGLFHLAADLYEHRLFKEAADHFDRYIKVAKAPGPGLYWLGMAHAGAGEEPKARKAFLASLKASPDHDFHAHAAWELDVRIQKTGSMQRAKKNVDEARKIIKEYEPILKLAPANATVRNNLAFTLREAYGPHKGSAKWLPILKACVKYYVEASEILGPWSDEKENTLKWQQRYAQAQIISDTGLMFQFYESMRDLKKAGEYYERALEYTDDGYRDAFNNYAVILRQQERWQDLYDLAAGASVSITQENGEPDERTRQAAEKIMKELIDSGKAKD